MLVQTLGKTTATSNRWDLVVSGCATAAIEGREVIEMKAGDLFYVPAGPPGHDSWVVGLGLAPSPIEARPTIDHEVFTIREPAGHVITFFSSHVSGKPL
jgi:hypothetical protein